MTPSRLRIRTLLGGAVLLALAGCASNGPPLFGPDTPRNGAGQPVDPVYGTPLPPGYPLVTVP